MKYGEEFRLPEVVVRVAMTAHHEAGHIVIAALNGLPIRPEGIMVDPVGSGLACYCKHPTNEDTSRERVIISIFAGHMAQYVLSERNDYPLCTYFEIIFSPDWLEARTMMLDMSEGYRSRHGVDTKGLEERAEMQVAENWVAIESIASRLLAKDWESLKPLKSGSRWSNESQARYVPGDELLTLLSGFGVPACISEY